jgi:hypothetical protein
LMTSGAFAILTVSQLPKNILFANFFSWQHQLIWNQRLI